MPPIIVSQPQPFGAHRALSSIRPIDAAPLHPSAHSRSRYPLRRERSRPFRVVFADILLSDRLSRRDAHPCRPCPSDLLRPEPGPGPRLARFAPPPAASGRIEIQRQGKAAMCRCPSKGGLHLATRPRQSRPSGPDPAPAPVPFGRIRGDGAGKGPVPAPRQSREGSHHDQDHTEIPFGCCPARSGPQTSSNGHA
jgi:hypothetical protein